MKKYLLTAINAKYIHSNLAVYSLKASAKAAGFDVELAEFSINHYVEQILRGIYERRADVLFFSCYIWNWEYVKEVAAECRKVMPDVPIWVGGPEVSYDAETVLRENEAITGVLIGEGEESFPKLLKLYETSAIWETHATSEKAKQEFSANVNAGLTGLASETLLEAEKIDGIAYRTGRSQDDIVVHPQRCLPDFSALPFAYEDMDEFANKIIYYESSRGCPFSCSYCLSSIDKRVRFRNLDLVKKELQLFIDEKVPQVKFVDRTFNCKESHAMEIWNYIAEHDNGITNFHFEIAADVLTDREVELMRTMRPGLIQLEIGVQSTYGKTIREIRRVMDFEEVAERVRTIKSFHNIHQHLDLIAGLPFETMTEFKKSFDDVFGLRPDQLQLGFLKVLKGSYMFEQAANYGIAYRSRAPYEVLSTQWMSYDDLLHLKGIEDMVEVYYNTHQFDNTLEELLLGYDSAYTFFEELADFYTKNGWNLIQHSRQQRYAHLLEFAEETCGKLPSVKRNSVDSKNEEDLSDVVNAASRVCSAEKETREKMQNLRELLTRDYYLRDRAKSRPTFAPDQTIYKEEIRELQKEYGKEVHIEITESAGEKTAWIFDYNLRDKLSNDASLIQVNLLSR